MGLTDIKKKIIKGSFYTSFGQIISIIFLFATTALLARYISKNDLGLFFILLTVSGFLEMLAALGLEPALVKFQSEIKASDKLHSFNKLFALRILTQIVISLFFFITTILLETTIEEQWFSYNYYIIILFNLNSLRNFFNAQLQSDKLFKSLAFIQFTQSILKILSYSFILLFSSFNISNLILVEIISVLLTFVLQLNYLKSSIHFYQLKIKDIKEIMSFSFPLYLNNFLNFFSGRLNNIIIAFFAGLPSVANYELARKIPDASYRLTSSLTLVYYPYISDLMSSKQYDLANDLLSYYIKYLYMGALPLLIIFYLLKEYIIQLIFSQSYYDISFSVFLLLITYLLSFTSSIMGYTLVASGNSKFSFQVNFTRTIISLILSIPFIYLWNYKGAIYSILISNILGLSLSIVFLKKVRINFKLYLIVNKALTLIFFVFLIYIFDLFIKRSIILTLFLCGVILTSFIFSYSKNGQKLFPSKKV